jgi:hypothetical protein
MRVRECFKTPEFEIEVEGDPAFVQSELHYRLIQCRHLRSVQVAAWRRGINERHKAAVAESRQSK